MANKQTWQHLMSGFPFVRPDGQATYDATVAAEWQKPGLIDWSALRLGGMRAYEQALRDLEAGYLELTDRNAEMRKREQQLLDQVEGLAKVCRDLAEVGGEQAVLLAQQDMEIIGLAGRLAVLESRLRRHSPISGEES